MNNSAAAQRAESFLFISSLLFLSTIVRVTKKGPSTRDVSRTSPRNPKAAHTTAAPTSVRATLACHGRGNGASKLAPRAKQPETMEARDAWQPTRSEDPRYISLPFFSPGRVPDEIPRRPSPKPAHDRSTPCQRRASSTVAEDLQPSRPSRPFTS